MQDGEVRVMIEQRDKTLHEALHELGKAMEELQNAIIDEVYPNSWAMFWGWILTIAWVVFLVAVFGKGIEL